jgi:hypothetical protein
MPGAVREGHATTGSEERTQCGCCGWPGWGSLQRYAAMVPFLRDALGLRVEFEEPATVEFSLPNDDRLQVFAPANYITFFTDNAGPGPIVRGR